jgi:hypothetical protein
MVDLPIYLTERANAYDEPVSELVEEYGSSTNFLHKEADRIPIPVISGSIDPPDYAAYLPAYRTLEEEYDRIALRLMLTDFGIELTDDQKDSLEELAEELRDRDIVLFDLVDNGVRDELKTDLRYLANLFENNLTGVLNAFDAYNGHPENQSPHLAEEFEASAFGDFGINQRFKPDGGGAPANVKHRHYHPNHSTVEFFEGNDYIEAQEELTSWSEWNRSHCDGCRRAGRTSNNDPNTWKQIKMTHYFSSVLAEEI